MKTAALLVSIFVFSAPLHAFDVGFFKENQIVRTEVVGAVDRPLQELEYRFRLCTMTAVDKDCVLLSTCPWTAEALTPIIEDIEDEEIRNNLLNTIRAGSVESKSPPSKFIKALLGVLLAVDKDHQCFTVKDLQIPEKKSAVER